MGFKGRHGLLALGFVPALSPIVLRTQSLLLPFRQRTYFPQFPGPSRRAIAIRRGSARSRLDCMTAPSTLSATSIAASDENPSQSPSCLTFQDALQRLQRYWADAGCIIWHPYNVEVGAGTMNPATFLRVLGPEPWAVAYDEPSIRPDDSRYGDNPNRLQRHTQFQVIVKPAPEYAQELVVGSYRALGIDTCKHDIRFVEDNWESPALGAWGLGWEVWLDGMEVTQFTYFQQAGGIPLENVAVEITYGLERIVMSLQGKKHFKDIIFAPGVTYGEIFMQNEVEMSRYNLDEANISRNNEMFELYEKEALALLEKRLPIPAYNYLLKASQTFNVLDARSAIGVTERARYFQRMRFLARDVAKLWIERREEEGFPLLVKTISKVASNDPSRVEAADCILTPTADFLLEIGLEELPAADVTDAIAQVEKLISGILADSRFHYASFEVNGSPRRVSVLVRDLKTYQDDESRRIRGPPLRIALKDGKMTQAATGFLKSQGVTDENKVEFSESDGYMYATVHNVGRPAVEVLAETIPMSLLGRINFGKSMRWNESGIYFSRPIRWLLCLLDDQLIPFEFAGVQSGKTTRSLRGNTGFAADVEVSSATDYPSVLSSLQIISSRDDRAAHIRNEATKLTGEIGGSVPSEYLDGALFDELTDLVENPIPLLGRFDETFLQLPGEVLITVMKKHQRYLPVVCKTTGSLMNSFIAVANGDANLVDIDAIRQGNEAVLHARYSDAAFFYKKDSHQKQLGDFVKELRGVTFQESLGSMLDKVRRVEKSTRGVCRLMRLDDEETETAIQAAKLYKADLATSMVIEMTSLAGIMGRHYAEKSQEVSPVVSQALFEANLPRYSGDIVPESRPGAAVSVADRIDSLVALFSVGLVPKSTADPFALRRAAVGAVQALIACGKDVDLRDVVTLSASALSAQSQTEITTATIESVVDFIVRRLETYLLDTLRVPDDVVKAVLAVTSNATNPVLSRRTCESIHKMLSNQAEREIIEIAQEVHGRAARLLRSAKGVSLQHLQYRSVDDRLFDCDEERRLLGALLHDKSDSSIGNRLRRLVFMKGAVDDFFTNVYVNSEDENVRLNRLALCSRIVAVTDDLLDLTLLQL